MSESRTDVLLSAVRTYADDFARANPNKQTVTKKTTEKNTVKINTSQTAPPQPQPTPAPTPEPQVAENPPFHFIQSASSKDKVVPLEEKKKKFSISITPKPEKKEADTGPVIPGKFAGSTIVEKQTTHNDRESILSSEDEDIFKIPSTDPDKEGGSIVTDKKENRVGFIKAMYLASAEAISKLIKRFSKNETPAKEPVTQRVKTKPETVKKAAKASAIAPTQNRSVVTKPLVATPPPTDTLPISDEKVEPQWSYTEDTTATIPEVKSAETQPEEKVPEAVTEEPVIPPLPEQPTEAPPLSSTAPKSVVKPASVVTPPTTDPAPAPVPAQTTPQAAPANEPIAPATDDLLARTSAPRRYRATPEPAANTRLILVITVVVLAVAVVGGVGVAYWLFGTETEEPAVAITPIPSIVRTETATPIDLGTNQEELLRNLTAAAAASPQRTQLYPILADAAGVDQPASAEKIIDTLAPRAPGNFQRNIETITFGVSAGNEPYIALRVQSFDVALSGMIAWEDSMSIDLEPFLGERVRESFDPDARTVEQLRPAFFTDAIINNRDVRLLRDQFAEDAILYSFINRNTILITTNRDAFAELLPLIQ